MNFRRISVLLLAAAALYMAGCTKDDAKKNYPSMLPEKKIAKVYEASTTMVEMKDPVTGEWKEMTSKTNERTLAHEFTWVGNQLESFDDNNRDVFYSFHYDEHGRVCRIISDNGYGYSRDLFYGEDGLLYRSEGSVRSNEGKPISIQTHIFTWADGVLKKVDETTWTNDPVLGESFGTASCTYEWEGGNVISTSRHSEINGSVQDVKYAYEYSDVPNPLQGFVFCMLQEGIIFDYEGIDFLSKNMPLHISSETSSFDYSISGNPVTSFEKQMSAGTATSPIRTSTKYAMEFEYLQ